MLPSLRPLAFVALFLLLLPEPLAFSQSRGRTSGRDAEGSRTSRTEQRDARSSSRAARSQADEKQSDDKREATRSVDRRRVERSNSRNDESARDGNASRTRSSQDATRTPITGSATQRTEENRRTTTRSDRQRGDAARPQRDRRPSNDAASPSREVDRSPNSNVDRGRSNTNARSRDANRSSRGGRVVTPPPAASHPPVIVLHPHRSRVDARWPWEWRRSNHWSPRYRYRQRVIIDAGWLGHRRNDVIEVETTYRHRLRRADGRRAEIDVYVERIALFDRGRFIGEVDRIPNDLSRVRAVVNRNGSVRFDREIFLVGNRRVGFELISTRYYDGYILDAYNRRHGYKAGRLDFRRERVVHTKRSRFFSPFAFDGHVPLSLLPDDRGWLLDYGRESITGYYYDSRERDYRDDYDDWGDRGWSYRNYNSTAPGNDLLERRYDRQITTNSGTVIELKREEVLERLDD